MNKKILLILSSVLFVTCLLAQERSTYLAEMQVIKDKFDVSFVYDSSLRLDGFCESIKDRQSLQASVRNLFAGSGISYEIRGRTIILFEEPQNPAGRSSRPLRGLDMPWLDTLAAAVKTDWQQQQERPGTIRSDMPEIFGVISPLGEGDPIRWVQTLPGVATGADGTTAMYVRGGNLGNSLFSLDGVPVYGYSHLLGLTTVVPPEGIESVSLSRGGFEGRQGNFTSSHLQIQSRIPGQDGRKTSFAANNFLVSAATEGEIRDGLSYGVSGRISPLALEYYAFRGMLPDLLGGFDGFGAGVGDLYGRLQWEIDSHRQLSAFILGSLDQYRFAMADGTGDRMGWNNMIASARFLDHQDNIRTEMQAYVNRYVTNQMEDKVYRDVRQQLSLRSAVTEVSLSASRTHQVGSRFRYAYGVSLRDAIFNSGQVASVRHLSNALLTTAWAQGDYDIPDILSIMLAVRGNLFTRFQANGTFFTPDASLSFKWSPVRHFSMNLTLDRVSQFYHTLEGLPTGWSLDIVIPSGKTVRPETALQGYVGADLLFDRHSLSAGAFRKRMDGLVYYKYAPSLFNGTLADWEESIDTGSGNSYGAEFQYEYSGKQLHVCLAYTWSKTDRVGFASVLDGAPFHARFDRRHVMNASASWRGFNAAFTFQSGHWENSMSQQAWMHFLDETWKADYPVGTGINDYHMPDVLRLDLGYQFSFETRRCSHTVNVGVCNVTNHFNPFMLYFNASTENWEEIALLPVLPNFSYRISF